MRDAIPEFGKGRAGGVGLSNMQAFAPGSGTRSRLEVAVILATAIIVIGSVEIACFWSR